MIEQVTAISAEIQFEPERFGDLKYFVCDIAKARQILGWQPEVQPKQGVPLLIQWIEQNRELFTH